MKNDLVGVFLCVDESLVESLKNEESEESSEEDDEKLISMVRTGFCYFL